VGNRPTFCIDGKSMPQTFQDDETYYYIKVGNKIIQVERETGRHVVVGEESLAEGEWELTEKGWEFEPAPPPPLGRVNVGSSARNNFSPSPEPQDDPYKLTEDAEKRLDRWGEVGQEIIHLQSNAGFLDVSSGVLDKIWGNLIKEKSELEQEILRDRDAGLLKLNYGYEDFGGKTFDDIHTLWYNLQNRRIDEFRSSMSEVKADLQSGDLEEDEALRLVNFMLEKVDSLQSKIRYVTADPFSDGSISQLEDEQSVLGRKLMNILDPDLEAKEILGLVTNDDYEELISRAYNMSEQDFISAQQGTPNVIDSTKDPYYDLPYPTFDSPEDKKAWLDIQDWAVESQRDELTGMMPADVDQEQIRRDAYLSAIYHDPNQPLLGPNLDRFINPEAGGSSLHNQNLFPGASINWGLGLGRESDDDDLALDFSMVGPNIPWTGGQGQTLSQSSLRETIAALALPWTGGQGQTLSQAGPRITMPGIDWGGGPIGGGYQASPPGVGGPRFSFINPNIPNPFLPGSSFHQALMNLFGGGGSSNIPTPKYKENKFFSKALNRPLGGGGRVLKL